MNTDIVMNNTEASVAVKVIKGEEMRRFNFKGQSFQELKKVIAEIFTISSDDFSLQYEDDEKDRVTLSSDTELKEAIQHHKYVLRFFVVVTKPAAGDNTTPVSPFHPPHHPYHPHRRHHHGGEMMAAEGEVPPPPFGRHGHGPHSPHGRPFGPGPHRHHGHGPHGHHKRHFEKEEREAMKCERKKWKKQRKCEFSSSSSSSEDDARKVQKKEMRQLMKATKQSIKANWAPVKEANPAQWSQNRQLMIGEIKLAKRIIREQATQPASPVVVVAAAEPTQSVATPTGVEMQA